MVKNNNSNGVVSFSVSHLVCTAEPVKSNFATSCKTVTGDTFISNRNSLNNAAITHAEWIFLKNNFIICTISSTKYIISVLIKSNSRSHAAAAFVTIYEHLMRPKEINKYFQMAVCEE